MRYFFMLLLILNFSVLPGQNPRSVISIPGAGSVHSWSCNGLQFYDEYLSTTNSVQLWRTDGTDAGTFPLTSFPQGSQVFTGTNRAAVVGNLFYFNVTRAGIGLIELWRSDGTLSGTAQVDISPAMQTTDFIIGNSTHLFYSVGSPAFEDLYSIDNAGNITYLQRLTQPYVYGFSAGSACIFMDKLITWKQSIFGTNNYQLFISDGTIAGSYADPTIFGVMGTKMVSSGDNFVLMKIPVNSITANLFKIPGIANGQIGAPELFYALGDGDNLKDYNYHNVPNSTNGIATFPGSASLGNSILLSGFSDNHGWELWKTDGTAAGTVLVKDIYPGPGSGFPAWKGFVINGKFIFFGYTALPGYRVFYSDGTTAGTDFFQNSAHDGAFQLSYVCFENGKAFYPAVTNTGFSAIWQTDGSIENTLPITPFDMQPHGAVTPFGSVTNGSILYRTSDGTGLLKFMAELNLDFTLWNGAVDSDWDNIANWSPSIVPGTATNVLVPASAPAYCVLGNESTIKNLWINAYNNSITVNSALNLNEGLSTSVHNTIVGNGEINFTGTGTHIISGAGVVNIPTKIIGGGVKIVSNVVCKSILANPGTSVTVDPGNKLTVIGQ